MEMAYKITEVCGDWALHIPPYGKTDEEMILIFNSRNNAELVKSVLEWEDAHPNAAVPYMPTLTPPNEPLTLDELREMDEPVWVACKPIEGGKGYWCLCQHGHIITPAGSIFDMKEIPHWVFYCRPPEGEA